MLVGTRNTIKCEMNHIVYAHIQTGEISAKTFDGREFGIEEKFLCGSEYVRRQQRNLEREMEILLVNEIINVSR